MLISHKTQPTIYVRKQMIEVKLKCYGYKVVLDTL